MKKNRIDRVLLAVSICEFFLMSGSILLMSAQDTKLLPGTLFWGGLLLGAVTQVVLSKRRKAFLAAHPDSVGKRKRARIGLLVFAANIPALIADILMVCGIAATVAVFLITKGYGYICNLCLAVAVFASCMHCILNGKIFAMHRTKRRVRGRRKDHISTSEKGEKK